MQLPLIYQDCGAFFMDAAEPMSQPMIAADPDRNPRSGALDAGIAAALDWADIDQNDQGYWAGDLESNACMEAEWLLAFHILGYQCPWADDLVTGILNRQRPDGAQATGRVPLAIEPASGSD